jgi:hypothetical protein
VESYRNSRHNQLLAEGKIEGARRRYWPWILAGLAATVIAWGPIALSLGGLGEPRTMNGTADIPSSATQATVPISASLPYTLHGLTADWNTTVFVVAKHSRNFSVAFSVPAPEGGGSLDWEVIPRAGSYSVAVAETQQQLATPTAMPTPKPWQSFAENGYAGQVFVHEIQQNPIPGQHTVSIVATDASHQFAKMLLAWLQSNWTIISHGQPDAFIGEPSEYALDDGITIRARSGSVDAETLRLAFRGPQRPSGHPSRFRCADISDR